MDFIVDGLATGRLGTHPERGGCLHARVPGAGGRHQSRQWPRNAGAGAGDRRAWQTRECTLGQWAGVHFAMHDRLGRRLEGRAGAHPAGPTDAERSCRKLPWQATRRVPQRKLVQNPQRCSIHSVGLAPGIQHRETSPFARLPHPARVPPDARRERGHGHSPFANYNHQPNRDSSYKWMRKRGQVTRPRRWDRAVRLGCALRAAWQALHASWCERPGASRPSRSAPARLRATRGRPSRPRRPDVHRCA